MQCPGRAGNGIVSRSYFPLEVGNTWIYKTDSRFVTSGYVTRKVTGQQQLGTHLYSEITVTTNTASNTDLFLREESDGTIWRFTGTPADPKEAVYLNPGAAQLGPFQNALGAYADAAFQTVGGLVREQQVFVRGIGLVRNRADLLSGSSGGFASSLELVEVRLATGPRIEGPILPKISLSIEDPILDVTIRDLTNCAIPCYYAACGLGSPVDPPGTYKPCVRTRIETAADGVDLTTELVLRTFGGVPVLNVDTASFSGETVRYVQMPLYTEANKPLPTGFYMLEAQLKGFRGNYGGTLGIAILILEVR